ncbi:MAG: SAM-dependent methyltransferase [Planctomycetota bacterium]|jgi:SAM-dependent methyltransferase
MFRKSCLCCGASDLAEIIHLGMHPLADTFVPTDHQDSGDKVYPLICDFCPNCRQIQLRTITDPEERYVKVEYSYTSSNSKTARMHWAEYAQSVTSQCAIHAGSMIVEIGSNDGFLLGQFRNLGFQIQGVEPSPAMAEIAKAQGISTENDFFTQTCSERLISQLHGKPTLIVANNVFNHANDPLDFVRGVKNLLGPEGTFVFELPYWLCSIEQGKFDQIYHEHVSYFTVSYAINLFKQVGMHVVRAEEVNYHGGSIRVFVRHKAEAVTDHSVAVFVAREEKASLFSLETYRDFTARILSARNRFLEKLYALKSSGQHIVCVGAAAKGNTFLNFYNLDASVIDYVTDSSANKIGKYTPRTRIPIQDDQVLSSYQNVYVIILSWNLAQVLEVKLRQINPHVQLLNPYELNHEPSKNQHCD